MAAWSCAAVAVPARRDGPPPSGHVAVTDKTTAGAEQRRLCTHCPNQEHWRLSVRKAALEPRPPAASPKLATQEINGTPLSRPVKPIHRRRRMRIRSSTARRPALCSQAQSCPAPARPPSLPPSTSPHGLPSPPPHQRRARPPPRRARAPPSRPACPASPRLARLAPPRPASRPRPRRGPGAAPACGGGGRQERRRERVEWRTERRRNGGRTAEAAR